MSRAETTAGPGLPEGEREDLSGDGPGHQREGVTAPPAPRTARAVWSLGLFGSELLIVFRRARTLALLGVLAGVPVLVGVAVRIETRGGGSVGGDDGGGPAFLEQISNNGLFLAF